MNILGIHAGHDSSATIVRAGEVIGAVAEERFVRIKHYGGLPLQAISWCMKQVGGPENIDLVASTINPATEKFRQLFVRDAPGDTYYIGEPPGASIGKRVFEWIKGSTRASGSLPSYIGFDKIEERTPVCFVEHHTAHASSAYYTGGRPECVVVTADGIGHGCSMTISIGHNGSMERIREFQGDGSLGWFYSLATEALGWWPGDGEGKTMGLAPYGESGAIPHEEVARFLPVYEGMELSKPHSFGSIGHCSRFDTPCWTFPEHEQMTEVIEKYGREHTAAKVQTLLEDEMVRVVLAALEKCGVGTLCAAGGVFLNVKLNQRLLECSQVEDAYFFPAAGDDGLSVGAALAAYHYANESGGNRTRVKHVFWGPSVDCDRVLEVLEQRKVPYTVPENLPRMVAEQLTQGKLVGWFQGAMEFGPRALGNRSILADPRTEEIRDVVNQGVKYREEFRPFCPSMTIEGAERYLVSPGRPEPFMIVGYDVTPLGLDEIPGVVHVDMTCRPQIVEEGANPLYWRVINEFGEMTGVPVLLNTSFNVKGEPIVCTPRDAIKCFYDTGLDLLVIGSAVIEKR